MDVLDAGWADPTAVEARLACSSVPGRRRFPDGRELTWRQVGINGLINDPQLPFFVEYDDMSMHPSRAIAEAPLVRIERLTIAGDPERVSHWLGLPPEPTPSVIDFAFVAPQEAAGLLAVTFDTPQGRVTI